MHGENFLLAVARIALTFVTFAGIINLLRHGADKSWSKNETFGLKLMVRFDLGATFFALLPFPLFYTLRNELVVWRLSGILLTVFLSFSLVVEVAQYRSARNPRHPQLFRWLFSLPMILAIGIEAWSATFLPSLAVYSWGLLWLLIPPTVQFLIYLHHFGDPPQTP